MQRTLAWVLSLALIGSGAVAIADDGHDGDHEHHHSRSDSKARSDFALLNQPGGDVSVQCGAIGGGHDDDDELRPAAFTMFITMTNAGPDGAVQVRYADGDLVNYAIAANTTLNITLAAGGTVGTDDIITVTNGGPAVLAGQASIITSGRPHPLLPKQDGRSFCTTLP